MNMKNNPAPWDKYDIMEQNNSESVDPSSSLE